MSERPNIVLFEPEPEPKFPFRFPKVGNRMMSEETVDGITSSLKSMLGNQKAVVARVAAD